MVRLVRCLVMSRRHPAKMIESYASLSQRRIAIQSRTFGRSVVEPSLSEEVKAVHQTNPLPACPCLYESSLSSSRIPHIVLTVAERPLRSRCAVRTPSDFLEGCRRSAASLSGSLQKCYNAYNSYVAEGEAP